MKKILVVDNTFDPPHGSPEIQLQLREASAAVGPIEIVVARAPESKIPKDLSNFDGAVLSGSKTRIYENAPWIELEMDAIRALHSLKIPTLGICYGEQLIARTLVGDTSTGIAKTSEHGWVEIIQSGNPSALLAGLPKTFYSFQNHKDEVFALPSEFADVDSRSYDCGVQSYTVKGAPMWCLQFHPERGLEEGNKGLDTKLKENPSYPAMNRDKAEKVFDPNVGRKIFTNFLQLVWAKK